MKKQSITWLGAIFFFINGLLSCSPKAQIATHDELDHTNPFSVDSITTDTSSTVEIALLRYDNITIESGSVDQKIIDIFKDATMSNFTSTNPNVATADTLWSKQGRINLIIRNLGSTQINFSIDHKGKSYPVQFQVIVNPGPFSIHDNTAVANLEDMTASVHLAYYGQTIAYPNSEIISIMNEAIMSNFLSKNSRVATVDFSKSKEGIITLNLFDKGSSTIYFDVEYKNKLHKVQFELIVR